MPDFDLSLEELRTYRPDPTSPPDLLEFWERTLAEIRSVPLNVQLERVDYPARSADVYRVRFAGWQGLNVGGWYISPKGSGPWPCIVHYHGYSWFRGGVHEYLPWVSQGYASLAIDMPGQSPESEDPGGPGTAGTGWMTRGILSPETYYYRAAYASAVRALDVVTELPGADPTRIGVRGVSQGGALALAVAALDARPRVSLPEVPYLCHFKRAVHMATRMPYPELSNFARRYPEHEQAMWTTLAYFDNLNLADGIQAATLVSVGLWDEICPPSTIFAVYNRITATKDLDIFSFGEHEQFPAHTEAVYRWCFKHLG
jgi:cephalosporin-C deacetylase